MKHFSQDDYQEEDIKELIKQYQNLKQGRSHAFLEEDDFDRIIDYFDDREDLTEALHAAETGLEQFPYSAQLMLRKADMLMANRKYADALDVLETVALYDSNDINLYILKTDALLALDKPQEAALLLESSLHLFSGEERIELLFELADVYDDYEEFDKVYDCLQLVLHDDPNNEEALYKICFWTDFTGRYEESIQLHNQIINEYPYNEIAWFNLGSAFQGLKLYEKAIDAYQYALVIEEKFDYAYRNMADAYLRLRKYKDAIEALEKVMEIAKPEDFIFEAIGHCYHRLHNYGQARFYYKKASHLNPDDSRLYYKIAVTYMLEKQYASAVRLLESAMQMHRHNSKYNLAMGECMVQLGRFKEAIGCFFTVVKNKPKNIGGWEALIRCLFEGGFYAEAAGQCIAAIKATDGKPLFYYYYSAALLCMGKNKEALLQLTEALQKAPHLLKKFIDIHPVALRNSKVVSLIAEYKKK